MIINKLKTLSKLAKPVALAILALCVANVISPLSAHAKTLNLAPSAALVYAVKSSQKGIPVSGEAKVSWQVKENTGAAKTYRLNSETSVAIFGKILKTSSTGNIDQFGLAPEKFLEKRFRREEASTTFDRQTKIISFSDSDLSYPIKGGEQDRLSATWQLVALARSAVEPLQAGHEWKMFVAGLRDADPWVFKLIEINKIQTALGELEVLHIQKAPPPDAKSQQIEIWLATSLDYYPVRISFHDANGDQVEQKIVSIKKE
jgi:hypothetical protein